VTRNRVAKLAAHTLSKAKSATRLCATIVCDTPLSVLLPAHLAEMRALAAQHASAVSDAGRRASHPRAQVAAPRSLLLGSVLWVLAAVACVPGAAAWNSSPTPSLTPTATTTLTISASPSPLRLTSPCRGSVSVPDATTTVACGTPAVRFSAPAA